MEIYYSHCMSIYNTPQEDRDLSTLHKLFPNATIVNPNSPSTEENYKIYGMDYFRDVVQSCDVLVFRGVPSGKIPAGIFEEIMWADEKEIPIIELPCLTDRCLSVEDTRFYLKEVGYR